MIIPPITKTDKFSDISQDIGQIFFAGFVVGPIVGTWSSAVVISGIILSLGFWYVSILFAKK